MVVMVWLLIAHIVSGKASLSLKQSAARNLALFVRSESDTSHAYTNNDFLRFEV